jgi:hypothetical protein
MLTRLRLLKGATALLYLGPLFAGLCGFGWGMVLPFVAVFAVWLMVLRPEQWPAAPEEWLTLSAWGAALTQILSQVLLVLVLLAIGRGLGGIAGFVPILNPILPLALSFLAIPLCRMLWDAGEAADQGVFLDDEAEAAHAPRAAAAAATAIVPLLNLGDDAPDQQAFAAVAQAMNAAGAEVRLKALTAALAKPDRSHAALRRAIILWATEPEIVAPGRVQNGMANAFTIANGDPDLLRLFLPRALALVAAFPDRADGFPSPARLRQAAGAGLGDGPNADLPVHLRDDLRDGLRALARAVEAAVAAAGAQAPLQSDPVTHHAAGHA